MPGVVLAVAWGIDAPGSTLRAVTIPIEGRIDHFICLRGDQLVESLLRFQHRGMRIVSGLLGDDAGAQQQLISIVGDLLAS